MSSATGERHCQASDDYLSSFNCSAPNFLVPKPVEELRSQGSRWPRQEKKEQRMSFVKTIALAIVLMFGASQLVFAQAGNPYAGGGGAGTVSGHAGKAQNNNRGPGKNPGGPGQGYQ
jgi:hypothetical protein